MRWSYNSAWKSDGTPGLWDSQVSCIADSAFCPIGFRRTSFRFTNRVSIRPTQRTTQVHLALYLEEYTVSQSWSRRSHLDLDHVFGRGESVQAVEHDLVRVQHVRFKWECNVSAADRNWVDQSDNGRPPTNDEQIGLHELDSPTQGIPWELERTSGPALQNNKPAVGPFLRDVHREVAHAKRGRDACEPVLKII